MFRKRYRQQIPELNTTSTADISFMLLIFFLVTSSMDTEKGLLRQMAPPPQEQQLPQDINQEMVVKVVLDGNNQLTCDGKAVSYKELQDAVVSMASVNREGHVVSVQADRQTSYEAYFKMQDALVGAYLTLRNQYAKSRFGKSYAALTSEERQQVNAYYPQRISESPLQEGGRP